MNVKYAKGLKAKWKSLFGRPADLDPRYRFILERKFLNVRHQQKPTLAQVQYITGQTILSLILLFVIVLFEHYLTGLQLLLWSTFIMVSLVNSGAILDQRRWIFYLEYARIFVVMMAVAAYFPNGWVFSGIIIALLLMTWYFRPMQRCYLKLLYMRAR